MNIQTSHLSTPKASTASSSASSTSRVPPSPPAPASPSIRRLWVWGENGHGELSSGDELDIRSPLELRHFAARNDIAQFSLGLQHSVCLTMSNDVYTCGSWISGLLGHEDRSNIHRLKRLKQFSLLKQLHPSNPIISIGCGDRHSVALHASGELYSWGGTLYGKLGRSGDSHNAYYLVTALQGKRVTQVACGNWHTAVCTDEGEVFSFGGGGKHFNRGALGTGDTEDSLTPRRLPAFGSSVQVRNVVCGGYHTLALTADRRVYSWGRGEFGQLGHGSDNNETEPRLLDALSREGRVQTLAAGENHSLAAMETGEVWSWGYGQQGQLGHGEGKNEKLPRRVAFFTQRNVAVVQVAAGWRHSLALTVDMVVYSWGHGDKGQLGLGDTRSSLLPAVVESLLGKEVKQVAAGGSHSLAFNAYFKGASELYQREQIRQAKERRKESGETAAAAAGDGGVAGAGDSGLLDDLDGGDGDLSIDTSRAARRPSDADNGGKWQEEKRSEEPVFLSPLQSGLPQAAVLPQPASGRSSLCVELVYSAQVQLTHRFVTFQTLTAAAAFSPALQSFIEQSYSEDAGMVFDNFIVSPGNVLPRHEAHPPSVPQSELTSEEQERGSHVFEYDDGPSRVTVMLVTRTHADDENLWPAWADRLYSVLLEACGGGDAADGRRRGLDSASVFQPCFREIRPAALREIIQQRQRRPGR